jgi:cell wall-associated NlpC family hydrolase
MLRRLALLFVVSVMAAACAARSTTPGRVPAGAPAATGGRAPSSRAEAAGHRVAAAALELRGVPYRNGGTDPGGFDCSGLVRYVFDREGVALPRQTAAQFRAGVPIRREAVRAGDLLFFSTVAPGASHVAIALDEETFVHAPSSRGVVRVERLALPYWNSRFVGARRVIR